MVKIKGWNKHRDSLWMTSNGEHVVIIEVNRPKNNINKILSYKVRKGSVHHKPFTIKDNIQTWVEAKNIAIKYMRNHSEG